MTDDSGHAQLTPTRLTANQSSGSTPSELALANQKHVTGKLRANMSTKKTSNAESCESPNCQLPVVVHAMTVLLAGNGIQKR